MTGKLLGKLVVFFASLAVLMPPGWLMPANANGGQIKEIDDCTLPPVPPEGEIKLLQDITYNTVDGEDLLLDIALPGDLAAVARRPLVIVLHGGAFAVGDKSTGGGVAQRRAIEQLAGSGFVAISANYRLSKPGINPFPAAVQDVRCLVRWAKINAARYHVAPNRIAITGVSAGGGLAASVVVMDDATTIDGQSIDDVNGYHCKADDTPLGKVSSTVNRSVIYYGPSDFTIPLRKWGSMAPFIVDYVGGRPAKEPRKAAAASPISYVSGETPSTLLLHGDVDDKVPYGQSRAMRRELSMNGVRTNLVTLEGVGHSFLMFDKDYFRTPNEDDDLSVIPQCTDADPPGTLCQMETDDMGTVIKIVDAVKPAACTSLGFLNEIR